MIIKETFRTLGFTAEVDADKLSDNVVTKLVVLGVKKAIRSGLTGDKVPTAEDKKNKILANIQMLYEGRVPGFREAAAKATSGIPGPVLARAKKLARTFLEDQLRETFKALPKDTRGKMADYLKLHKDEVKAKVETLHADPNIIAEAARQIESEVAHHKELAQMLNAANG